MTVFIVTGPLGAGKTICAVGMLRRYARRGRRIASNLSLNLEHLVGPRSKATAIRLPGYPREQDLQLLGRAYDGPYDENKFGLVVLDEAGSWLNSQDWRDPDRRGLFRWITHARKHGWDVALIVQDWETMDAQIRRSVSEVVVSCTRSDRLPVLQLLPRFHLATKRYRRPDGLVLDRDFYWGRDLYASYDTCEAVVRDELATEDGLVDMRATSTTLSGWHRVGRFLPEPPPWWSVGLRALLSLMILLVTPVAQLERAVDQLRRANPAT